MDGLFRKKRSPEKQVEDSGRYPLEVKGEATYQDALIKIARPKTSPEGISKAVTAILEPDPTNPYDPNAVKVIVGGLHVGFVNREDAPAVHEAVARIQEAARQVSLRGKIIGGWKDGEDEGHYGIWLYADASKLGLT